MDIFKLEKENIMSISSLYKRCALSRIVVAVGMLLLACTAARAESIDDAVAHVKGMVKSGASRYDIGRWVTSKLDYRIRNLNSPWEGWVLGVFKDSATADNKAFGEWRDKGVFSYDAAAKWAWEKRIGQCEEQACTAYYILKKAGVPGRLQIVGTKGHAFVVWGMAGNANVSDEKTWGRDTVIVDGWLGRTSRLEPVRIRGGSAINLHAIYLGPKTDHTPAYEGSLVIGGPWDLVIDWKNAKRRQKVTQIALKLIINQTTADTFDGVITKGALKVELTKGKIYEKGIMRFNWSANQLVGVSQFRFTNKEAKLFKGQYSTKIVYEGKVYSAIVPFTGEVNARKITIFPMDPIVNAQ